ncbi:unnamed protein product [Spirodela intermedia]|uniref:Uncharacterized protein n=1 Tax=Spirodela intermedia TaxID=51605 RepID=A0A7I8JML0_SPIIN|nr:unnamed protein product [Spirodela intermedia]CAA6671041.1 unnamed protein product [Spirodela intermedia]
MGPPDEERRRGSITTMESFRATNERRGLYWLGKLSEIANILVFSRKTMGLILNIFDKLVFTSTSRRRRSSSDDVVMVDPLEAKRLAAQQMQEIQAKQKLKRQRRIEAINGAWAVIGLTAGLVVEVQTGDSIPAQLARYWSAIVSQFWQW